MVCVQILQNARLQLEHVVRDKLAAAIGDGQHSEVVRFAKLFKPLRIQVCARLGMRIYKHCSEDMDKLPSDQHGCRILPTS